MIVVFGNSCPTPCPYPVLVSKPKITPTQTHRYTETKILQKIKNKSLLAAISYSYLGTTNSYEYEIYE